ncbi:MAG TPA: hypothetical protein VGE52_18980 [Pirellulales bacterium]
MRPLESDALMERIRVVFTGDLTSPEFLPARARLAALADLHTLPLGEARAALEDRGAALVVVGKSFPEQFSPAAIETLRQAAPLARLVVIEGSWCESESRTGRIWPGVARVPWSAAEAALQREATALAENRPSRWSGPATAAPFEAALAESELPLTVGTGRVAIHAETAEHFSWLGAACLAAGYEPLAAASANASPLVENPGRDSQKPSGIVAALWQGTHLAGDRAQETALARFTAALAAPTLVLLDFPRRQDLDAATQAGASGVLGVPCSVLDLSTALALAMEERNAAGLTRPGPCDAT